MIGVPQASALGPSFSIIINDLSWNSSVNWVVYADDTSLFTISLNPDVLQANTFF